METWECPREPGVASRDGLLIDPRPDRLRLAVVDGVTPTPFTRGRAGVDGALWAMSVVRAALLARAQVETCALAANAELREGTVSSPRDRPQATFAAVDLDADGATLVRAGDCEAWLERGGGWSRVFPREIDTPAERARMEQWTREHPERPFMDYDRGRPEGEDIWTTIGLGRLERPLLQTDALATCAAVVLATDGARLDEAALDALPEWLEQIAEVQRDRPASRWERGADDVAVIRARRRA